MAVFSIIRGALQQNEAIIMCKKIGIIQTSILTNTHGVVGVGMLLGRGRSQNAPQLGEGGQETPCPHKHLINERRCFPNLAHCSACLEENADKTHCFGTSSPRKRAIN